MGSVYAIGCGGSELIKVGFTEGDPAKRMRALQTGQPEELHLLYSWPSDRAHGLERAMHRLMADCRYRGEWYRVSLDQVADAYSLATGHNPFARQLRIAVALVRMSLRSVWRWFQRTLMLLGVFALVGIVASVV